ncbi:hydrolase, carbon-nitrogen family, putative [Talaromyces stipitatus ATCC 10500]|uniref:Hydrolase, carbon-nitrogen family, putative n=1 Tax=Talaromyces stipitatus (strain ATCC 10500 / CBS 375.48 / QM 6759 / NRRL 1006) TaxID=441959 RepID=B8MBF6_TALSN|nr:hydrolase, carbon-nitrogen family, putative [Talaromyces stipitatus ATCC 10500]EED17820.1 hydrolase, carbon-nitrogen family, putative [Talaromyces stipitatus ATCC 10500]
MAPIHKVAVIQWHIKNLDPEYNHSKAIQFITSAASNGATLAVLPEYHLCGWAPESPEFYTQALRNQPYLKSYCQLAKALHINIVPGTIIEAERKDTSTDQHTLYNTAYFISSSGEILGKYRKKNIWHPERPHLTSSGADPHEVIQTGVGKVGMLICWDLAFPEAFRELISKGAEIIIIPTYWGKHDANEEALKLNPNSEQLFIDSTLTSRCFENTCAIIFANAAGPADFYLGSSRVVLPFIGAVGGKTMGAEEEGVMVVELDLSVLALAEENYKVRQDMASEGWYYSYRHTVDKRPAETA